MTKKHLYKAVLIFFLITGLGVSLSAQSILSTKSKKAISYYQEADNYRVRRQYDQAIILLNAAIKKDETFIEAYMRLGRVYHAKNELNLADKNYQTAINLTDKGFQYNEAYLLISEIQITLEKYNNVKNNTETYLSNEPKNLRKKERAQLLQDQADYALNHINETLDFNPKPLSNTVNQFALQYFPVITADQNRLFYTKREGNSPYDDEDIVFCAKEEDGLWSEPQSISSNINSELNEGTCSISANGRIMVFTSCQGRKGYGSCDLYISHKIGDEWSVPRNMGGNINTSAWESQPSLSADGRRLYFVSNRRGGIGGRDIWVSTLVDDNWSVPVNLGNQINTKYEEVSPFTHQNGKVLYFASNGKPGFGGFDIYYSNISDDNSWVTSMNLGYPINRGNDQMSIIITADGVTGYYSDSGRNNDVISEIRQFKIPQQIKIQNKSYYVKGVVKDSETDLPLKASVQLYDIETNELVSQTSSDSLHGDYLMTLTEGDKYGLYIDKEGYVFKSLSFDMSNTGQSNYVNINIELDPIRVGATTVLSNIFFEHDSYELSDESLIELKKIAEFIKKNKVVLEIGGYTDSTGSEDYNKQLSINRAKAVYKHLIQNHKIPQNRLTYKGYGESKSDSNTPNELARRIEFKLLSM